MDFISHLLWSGIIFVGSQFYLACFCYVLPDLAAFLNTLIPPQNNSLKNEIGRKLGKILFIS